MQVEYKKYKNILWRIDRAFAEPADIMQHLDFECASLDFKYFSKTLAIRWVKKTQLTKANLWFVVQDRAVQLTDLSSNTRSKVRRGIRRFELKPVSRQDIATKGYFLYKKLFRFRYGKPMSYSAFARHIAGLPAEFIFFGVFDRSNGELAGYLQIFEGENHVYLRVINILPQANRNYASYAVFYLLNEIFFQAKGKVIVLGLRSLTGRSNIQHFVQEKFFYRRDYIEFGLCLSYKAKAMYLIFRPIMRFLNLLKLKKVVYLRAFLEFIYLAKKRK